MNTIDSSQQRSRLKVAIVTLIALVVLVPIVFATLAAAWLWLG